MALVYKICTEALWDEMQRTGKFFGMPIDLQDGYVHLSTAEQQPGTVAKYFAGAQGMVVLALDTEVLGAALVWEAASSGDRAGLFPHLYGPLTLDAVRDVQPL